MSKAVDLAFIVDGLHDAGYEECIKVMSEQGQGCVEMIWALEKYAEYLDALHIKVAEIVDMGDGHAGVFEYEVSSSFGEWYGKHIIEKLGPPSKDDAHKQILELSVTFLTKEDKSEEFVQFVTKALNEASTQFFLDKKYVSKDGGGCPACGSDQIEGGSFDVDGNTMRQEMVCMDCDAGWEDVYRRVGFNNLETQSS